MFTRLATIYAFPIPQILIMIMQYGITRRVLNHGIAARRNWEAVLRGSSVGIRREASQTGLGSGTHLAIILGSTIGGS